MDASLFGKKLSIEMHLANCMHLFICDFIKIGCMALCLCIAFLRYLAFWDASGRCWTGFSFCNPCFSSVALKLFDTDDWPDPSVSEIQKNLSYRHQCCRNRINSLIYDTTHTETCRKPIKTHVNDEKYAFQNEKASSHLRQRQFT